MMGQQCVPADSHDPFRLDDYVPVDHPLRQLDAILHLDRVIRSCDQTMSNITLR
jgi:hypothetical protein